MKIVHVAAECTPIAKVGGLGEVILGLSRSLIHKNKSVEVILPKYDVLLEEEIEDLVPFEEFLTYFNGCNHKNTAWKGKVRGIPLTFLQSHDPWGFFERKTVYGQADDIERFLYFSLASLAYLKISSEIPDIVHIHDWHTAFLAPLLKEKSSSLESKVVFSIHNFTYQGRCSKSQIEKSGLKVEGKLKEALQDEEGSDFNLLKGAVFYSDYITTVSPTYAQETLTGDLSYGLNKTLNRFKNKYRGIVNGLDNDFWDPTKDPYLPFHFSKESLKNEPPFLFEKEKIKSHVQEKLSLKKEKRPLVAAITRLVYQKGPQLIKEALKTTLEIGGQFILLGATSDEKTKEEFSELKDDLKDNPHVHIELEFNEKLSHLVFAASDLFIVPSIFEPCGLTQLVAMRYGAVPVVRKTGGLADTVFEDRNGFLFGPPTLEAINETLKKALKIYFEEPAEWHKLLKNALSDDVSWDKSAEEYLQIYLKLVNNVPVPRKRQLKT